MKIKILVISFLLILSVWQVNSQTVVRDAFNAMSAESKPWCFWYWMHGCVSREGIKADLEAMQEAGLGGAYLMPVRGKVSPSKYEPVVEQLTPEWWKMVRYAMDEAKRLDLKIAMHICDGFALAGGPWITPERSMQKLVWTETRINGKNAGKIKLVQPETILGYYEDIRVLAYPTPSGIDNAIVKPKKIISSDTLLTNLSFLVDENGKDTFRSEDPGWIQYEYEKPYLCRSIITEVNGTVYQAHRLKVEASNDGKKFWFVTQLEAPRHGWQNTGANVTHSIPATKARYFRFVWTKEGSVPGAEDMDNAKWKPTLKLTGLFLSSEPKIHHFEGKNAGVWRLGVKTTEKQVPTNVCIKAESILDITETLGSDGVINWKAPKGNWTILRIGHTTSGITNSTGGAGMGLECDKLNYEAVRMQFDNWFGKACEVAGPDLVSEVLSVMHIDSWECGSQNWTKTFPQEFEKRRGYSLMSYLPVLTGVPVGSAEKTEQILFDVRQTVSEMVNDIFFKTFTDAAHSKGCKVSAECVAPTMMSDGLRHYQIVDIPMGEFWYDSPTHDKPNDMLDAISGAHIYGKNIIQAEGFTQLRTNWSETPATHKTLLDRNLALGINRMVFHIYTHNPFMDRKPGMTLNGIGLFFQRDQTWWKPGRAWIDYIRRCQSLLQIGKPVVDIAVFNGLDLPGRAVLPDRLVSFLPGIFGEARVSSEKIRLENKDVPMTESPVGVTHISNIALAEDWVDPLRGYSYDTFNPDVLFRLAKTDKGIIKVPGGPEYKMLIVPGIHPMSPNKISPNGKGEIELRKTLKEFGKNNIKMLLPDYLSEELNMVSNLPWKEDNFSSIGLKRDFEVSEDGKPAFGSISWTHRTDKGIDIYFIANQLNKSRKLDIILRVAGMVPEIFDPVTGTIMDASSWRLNDGRTNLKLELDANASVFVVFEKPVAETTSINYRSEPIPNESKGLEGPWIVQFDTTFWGPEKPQIFNTLQSWSTNKDSSVRHYSGTALYTNSIRIDFDPEIDREYFLYLGKVFDLAEVKLNGINCGIAWTAPYRVDISKALKKGENKLELYVTNTWSNRIEADDRLPEKDRLTWTDGKYRKKNRGLIDAGLLGPLSIKSVLIKNNMPLPNK